MKVVVPGRRPCRNLQRSCAGACTALLLFAASCANIGGDGDSGGTSGGSSDNGGGTGASSTDVGGDAIVNVAGETPIQISELEEPLSILYRVSASGGALVSSFYEPVERDTLQPVVGSEPTTIATLLPVGEGQFFFNPSLAGVGYYRVGLRVLDASGEQTIISEGVIHVQGPPNPAFRFPTVDTTVRLGEDINIHCGTHNPM